jgi:rubredoxin
VEKYKCAICGYLYEPELGDPEADIKAGTPFIELPDDYICPICGAGKDEFFINK